MVYVPRDMKIHEIDSSIPCTNFFVSIMVVCIFGSDYPDSFNDHQSFRKSVYWGS